MNSCKRPTPSPDDIVLFRFASCCASIQSGQQDSRCFPGASEIDTLYLSLALLDSTRTNGPTRLLFEWKEDLTTFVVKHDVVLAIFYFPRQ
jgi:hypothetical protein